MTTLKAYNSSACIRASSTIRFTWIWNLKREGEHFWFLIQKVATPLTCRENKVSWQTVSKVIFTNFSKLTTWKKCYIDVIMIRLVQKSSRTIFLCCFQYLKSSNECKSSHFKAKKRYLKSPFSTKNWLFGQKSTIRSFKPETM